MSTIASATVEVRFFGTFMFRSNGAWTSGPALKRGREFLQYLWCRPHGVAARDALIEALWPEISPESVTHRLHLAVSGARAALRSVIPAADVIRCNGVGYEWNPAIAIASDVDALLAATRHDDDATMERAVELYRGEFLAGESAEWIDPMRVHCTNAYVTILERLAERSFDHDDLPRALDYASLLVRTDRAHEGATRLLMRALSASGRRGAALTEFSMLAVYLQKHLGLEPSAPTRALRDAIIRE
jgi:DNA-binding SARP family transcriptional activator